MSPNAKKPRTEESGPEDTPKSSNGPPKYPFVDYDQWIASVPQETVSIVVDYDLAVQSSSIYSTSAAFQTARQPTDWFDMSKLSSEAAKRSQNSVVAHSPFSSLEELEKPPDKHTVCMYLGEGTSLVPGWPERTIRLPDNYFSVEYQKLLVADVVANGGHRDPTKYGAVWPLGFFGKPVDSPANLVVLTLEENEIFTHPSVWELRNRRNILLQLIEGVKQLAEFGDMVVPCRGLILSVWFGGILFRICQIFFKIAVVRSVVSWSEDDRFFVFCQGKRPGCKSVHRALQLLQRLGEAVAVDDTRAIAGYAVPPVCALDEGFRGWLQRVNAQLLVGKKAPKNYFSIEKMASALRLKKYLWPELPVARVGFYFGSFDPVHENHVALTRFAVEQLHFTKIIFVPNQDGHDAKNVSLLQHRAEMIRLRIRVAGLDAEVQVPTGSTSRWEFKEGLAESVSEKYFCESKISPKPALLLGQDSWNKAVQGSSRDKVTRHFIGIAKVGCDIVIFPRSDSELPVLPAPKPVREKVEIAEGYTDPVVGLSSSLIREKIRAGDKVPENWVHPEVVQYAIEHNIY